MIGANQRFERSCWATFVLHQAHAPMATDIQETSNLAGFIAQGDERLAEAQSQTSASPRIWVFGIRDTQYQRLSAKELPFRSRSNRLSHRYSLSRVFCLLPGAQAQAHLLPVTRCNQFLYQL